LPNRLFVILTAVLGVFLFSVPHVHAQTPPAPTCAALSSNYTTPGEVKCNLRPADPKVDLEIDWSADMRPGVPVGAVWIFNVSLKIDNEIGDPDFYSVTWVDAEKKELTEYKDRFNYSLGVGRNPPRTISFTPRLGKKTATLEDEPIALSSDTGGGVVVTPAEPPPRDGGGIGKFVADIIVALLLWLVDILYKLVSLLLIPVLKFVLGIPVHDFEFASVILRPWAVIRNLMNIFFMLSLIAVSLATLFRLGEKWNYRDVLVKLVIMALLINFSLSIAQVILGIAQTMQNQFLPADSRALDALAHTLLVGPMEIIAEAEGGLTAMVNAFVQFFFALLATMTLVAITAFAVVRIVMLWLLLMTSPVAYAAYVLPVTASYAKSWWSQFIRYAFLTPLLGLMLQICGLLAQSQAQYINGLLSKEQYSATQTIIYGVLSSSITVACLVVGLQTVTKGIKFAGDITKRTNGAVTSRGMKLVKSTGSGAKGLAARPKNAMKRNIQERAALNLANDKKGLGGSFARARGIAQLAATGGVGAYFGAKKNIRDERNKDAQQKAEANAKRLAIKRVTGVDDKGNIEAFSSVDDKNMSRYKNMGKNDLVAAYDALAKKGTPESRTQMRALIKSALASGKLNDVVKKKKGNLDDDSIHEFLNESLEDDPQKDIFLNALSSAAKKDGKLAYVGHTEKTKEERNKKRVEWVKDIDDEAVIAKLDPSGLSMNKDEHKEVLAAAMDKIGTQDVIGTNQATKFTFSAGKVDKETGRIVFGSEDEIKASEAMRKANPDVYNRMYNRLVGVSKSDDDGWQDYAEIASQGYVIEDVDADGKSTYVAATAAVDADGKVASVSRGASVENGQVQSAGQASDKVKLKRKEAKGGRGQQQPPAQPPEPPPGPPPARPRNEPHVNSPL
jgi:hypothetical protein